MAKQPGRNVMTKAYAPATVHFDWNEREILRLIAERNGVSLSKFVRSHMQKFIKEVQLNEATAR
jgi:hypothetical protein